MAGGAIWMWFASVVGAGPSRGRHVGMWGSVVADFWNYVVMVVSALQTYERISSQLIPINKGICMVNGSDPVCNGCFVTVL